jgi:hypothetical protein
MVFCIIRLTEQAIGHETETHFELPKRNLSEKNGF